MALREIEKLKTQHSTKDKKYPRPATKCPDCGETSVICWGNKIDVYVRHKGMRKECSLTKESLIHAMAKKLLCDYLNEGGVCSFSHRCHKGLPKKITNLCSGIKYITEKSVNLKTSVFDICGLNSNNEIIYCIEIKHTHKTYNTKDRDKLIWFEINATDVLKKLDVKQIPKEVNFTDIKFGYCCRKSCLTDSERLNIAKFLGYHSQSNVNKASFIHKLAIKGNACIKHFWYSMVDFEELKKEQFITLKDFVSLQQCLRCGKEEETSVGKLFCKKCYKNVMNHMK